MGDWCCCCTRDVMSGCEAFDGGDVGGEVSYAEIGRIDKNEDVAFADGSQKASAYEKESGIADRRQDAAGASCGKGANDKAVCHGTALDDILPKSWLLHLWRNERRLFILSGVCKVLWSACLLIIMYYLHEMGDIAFGSNGKNKDPAQALNMCFGFIPIMMMCVTRFPKSFIVTF